MRVSIPLRQAKNFDMVVIDELSSLFQFLLGRLKTTQERRTYSQKYSFNSS